MARLNAFYRPDITRDYENGHEYWGADIKLHPEPKAHTWPRVVRWVLKAAIGLVLAWWMLTWALALVGGIL